MDSLGEDATKLLQLLPQLREGKFNAIYYGWPERRRYQRISITPTDAGVQFALYRVDYANHTFGVEYLGEVQSTTDEEVLLSALLSLRKIYDDLSDQTLDPIIQRILMERLERLGPLTYFGE